MTTLFAPKSRTTIIPREYQRVDHDASFRLWDSGERGTLTRIFTGGGKTICACLKAQTWLERSPEHRVMVISYEKQLVWQFAEEIEDVTGITPGIEMERESLEYVPQIVVASRQSLMIATPPDAEQLEKFASYGIADVGSCTKAKAKTLLAMLDGGEEPDVIRSHIADINQCPEAKNGQWSRLFKFPWQLNWLLVFDEAHRHAYKLRTVHPIIDWFEQNPDSRWCGLTATPKRADNVSLGHKMFPGVAIDYPLFSHVRPCAVKDGYAVPYRQRYISVEGVDFKSIKKIAGDFDDAELERVLGEEKQLASLVDPLLNMVGDRQTLIFSPGVDMARNVARYINSRCEAECQSCHKRKWYPRALVGDGAKCECGTMLCPGDVRKGEDQAKAVWGELHPKQRREIYRGHQDKTFQFLSVCGLCREGYNDPNVSCIAVFRPVSKEASSLAEQMKGRGCRPLRGIINGIETAEARLAAIAGSEKPDCLIVDLVGITGLADCASTVQIYSDGIEDVVLERAAVTLSEAEEDTDVADAIIKARDEIAEERERIRLEREAAEKRAREEYERRAEAEAEVRYSEHEVGFGRQFDSNSATEKQLKFIESLGMGLCGIELSKRQCGRIIGQLKQRIPFEEVARTNHIHESQWIRVGPSVAQCKWMNWKRIRHNDLRSRYDARIIRDAWEDQVAFRDRMLAEIAKADADSLTAVAHDVHIAQRVLSESVYNVLVEAGKRRRWSLTKQDEGF